MNTIERIEKIKNISNNLGNKISEKTITWKGNKENFSVFKIPIELALYNPKNGRIASIIKTLKSLNGDSLDDYSHEGQIAIGNHIWESNISRNKKTQSDLDKKGQLEPAIITKDGILIDGNRRVTILRKLGQKYVEALVLPVELEEDPIEIQRLEYSFQINVDEKVDYNPIEKYIKANDFFEQYSKTLNDTDKIIKELAELNGKNKSEIHDYLKIYRLFEEYLKFIEAENCFILLDKREDLFLTLRSSLKDFIDENGDSKGSSKPFQEYTDLDVADLKELCFDYIRSDFEGKEFRTIAKGNRENIIFGDKNIWKSFYNEHGKIIKDNYKPRTTSKDDEEYLNKLISEEYKYIKTHKQLFIDNLSIHYQLVINHKKRKATSKTLSQTTEKIKNLNLTKSFNNQEEVKAIQNLQGEVFENTKNNPALQLKMIETSLERIEMSYLNEENYDEITESIKRIYKLIVRLKEKT